MQTLISLSLFFSLALSAAVHAEESGTVKQDIQGAAKAVKREWKKGWRATKKAAKEVSRGAADATEKTARKVKENIDD